MPKVDREWLEYLRTAAAIFAGSDASPSQHSLISSIPQLVDHILTLLAHDERAWDQVGHAIDLNMQMASQAMHIAQADLEHRTEYYILQQRTALLSSLLNEACAALLGQGPKPSLLDVAKILCDEFVVRAHDATGLHRSSRFDTMRCPECHTDLRKYQHKMDCSLNGPRHDAITRYDLALRILQTAVDPRCAYAPRPSCPTSEPDEEKWCTNCTAQRLLRREGLSTRYED